MWPGQRKAVLADELAAGVPGEERTGHGQPLLQASRMEEESLPGKLPEGG